MRATIPFTLIPFTLIVTIALCACASAPPTKALLTYKTVPDAAELFEGGKSLGMAPLTRSYDSDGKSANIQTPDVRAVWPSGAETTFFTVLPVGSDRVATLERPASAPGLQTDLEHARTVAATRQREAERLRAMQKRDLAAASARCKEQQAEGNKSLTDDCR